MFRTKRPAQLTASGEICTDTDTTPVRRGAMTLDEQVTELYRRWRAGVYRYLAAAFGAPAQAEEITQEAFLQLYRVLHSGQTIDNPRAWLFRVAHNAALNQIKSQQFLALLDDADWDEISQSWPDAALNPEQALLEQEKFSRLRLALGRLTATERHCLHLRTKGLRYREIADITGLGVSTVAETLYRVIQKLAAENHE